METQNTGPEGPMTNRGDRRVDSDHSGDGQGTGWGWNEGERSIFRRRNVPSPSPVTGFDLVIAMAIFFVFGLISYLAFDVLLLPSPGGTPAKRLLIFGLVSDAFTLLVSWYFVCRQYGLPFAKGFAIRRVRLRTVILSFAIGIALAAGAIASSYFYETGEANISKWLGTPEERIVYIVLALIGPFFEELYYRGFVFTVLRKYAGGFGAVLLVTIWFGSIHLIQKWGDPMAIAGVFVGGAVFTIQRHVTRSLLPSIITHYTYNVSLVLLVLLGAFLSR